MFLFSSSFPFRSFYSLTLIFLATCLLGCGKQETTPTNQVEIKTVPIISVDELETVQPSEEETTPVVPITLPKEEPAKAPTSEKPITASRKTELEQGLANLQIPPAWLADITSHGKMVG